MLGFVPQTPLALSRETADARRLATAALSPLASPLLPKGEANAKGEGRSGSPTYTVLGF